ncbi:hypothetical protein Tco_0440229, partial [Tanacetum coccineum]
MELEHHVLVYVLEHVYPEYLVTFDDDIPVKDPEEDPIDYVVDADNDEDEEEDSIEDDDDDEDKHLALANFTDVASPAADLVPSAEDTEPFKRLCLNAPIPRFDVGESYAAADRQPGSTVARRVNYSFVDTMDA